MLRSDAQLVEVKHGECVGLAKVFLRNRTENHADAGGVVRDGVDENERAGGFVVFIGIKEDFLGGEQRGASNLVEFKMVSGSALQRVHVNLIIKMVNLAAREVGRVLEIEGLLDVHWFFVHPNEHGFEGATHLGKVVGVYNHFPTADVYLVLQL